jgi:hypothetical protein
MSPAMTVQPGWARKLEFVLVGDRGEPFMDVGVVEPLVRLQDGPLSGLG